MNLNLKSKTKNSFDAIVIGSGISGGWAAKELCEKGVKTLLLERGRDVKHITDYTTANLSPWDFKHRLRNTKIDIVESPIQSSVFDESTKQFFVNDLDHPYIQEKPFHWKRGYQVGGRSLTWGRQCYRMSDLDFEANEREGIAVNWPIRYRDLEKWYDHVERFVGISGRNEGLHQLPDGKFIPPMELNCIEEHLANAIKANFDDRLLTIARVANLTQQIHGRGPCMYRNLCARGCPFAGYFSSNSATLPVAMHTGNLTIRPFSAAHEIIYDKEKRVAKGVRIRDSISGDFLEYYSKIIFLNASTINSAAILLNSKSEVFPNGLGNSSEQIGHNLMDHHSGVGATGIHHSFSDKYYSGRRPAGFYIPRFQNLRGSNENFLRGYGIQGKGERLGWEHNAKNTKDIGLALKEKLASVGPWKIWMAGWGECLPYYENMISLDYSTKDIDDMPLVKIDFKFKENEFKMMKHIKSSCYDMLDKGGFSKIESFDYDRPGGATVHEMGTARMGEDPKTSVLNRNNQMHDVKNVFITDGSCMTSSSCQNPSLTYMALTARACGFAVEEMKARNL